MRSLLLALGLIATALPLAAQSVPAPSPAPPSAPARSCPVDPTPSSSGDRQLSREDYKGAESTFRAGVAADPASLEARLGLVRALIGEDRVADAQAEAAAMLQAHPNTALAEVASSEAAYRAADIEAALKHAAKALDLDLCEARAHAALADVQDLSGLYAQGAHHLGQAHRLRPGDELIRRAWINTLPRKERQIELARYLQSPHDLSAEREQNYGNVLAHLQASRPGECRITSRADSTRIPLRPVSNDRGQAIAFGLDVEFNKTHRRMQIDTGASGIILTPSAARALKLEPEYRLKAGGVGDEGKVDSFLAHVPSITIGDIEISDCLVEVLGKTRLSVDGLIGMDVFSRFLVTLDYPNAQLQLDPLPKRPTNSPPAGSTDGKSALEDSGTDPGPQDRYTPPEFKDWSRIFRIGHQILLPARFRLDSSQHFLVMDTGASRTVLSPAMAREAGKLHSSPMRLTGLSGEVKNVYEIDPTQLFFANLKLPPERYFASDITNISHSNGFETSGLLGLPTLQRLTIQIDYRDNLLKLTYDPKHDFVRF